MYPWSFAPTIFTHLLKSNFNRCSSTSSRRCSSCRRPDSRGCISCVGERPFLKAGCSPVVGSVAKCTRRWILQFFLRGILRAFAWHVQVSTLQLRTRSKAMARFSDSLTHGAENKQKRASRTRNLMLHCSWAYACDYTRRPVPQISSLMSLDCHNKGKGFVK